MSLPWSGKDLKGTGEDNDEVLILDSSDSNPDSKNKRLKLSAIPVVGGGVSNGANLPGTASQVFAGKSGTILDFRRLAGESNKIISTQNDNDITFTLGTDVVTTDKANTYGDFAQTFPSDKLFINSTTPLNTYQIIAGAISANRVLTFPDLISNDIFVTEAFSQILTNKQLIAPIIASITNSGLLDLPSGPDTLVGLNTTDTFTGVKTFESGKLVLEGSTSGTTVLNAESAASGILTLPATTDTLVALTTTDTLTNKTLTAPKIDVIVSAGATLSLPTTMDTLVARATVDTFTNKTFNANATGNILSNVEVADLADRTSGTGQLITWNTSDAPTVVLAGNSGEVLTSQGGGDIPTFAPASTGSLSIVRENDGTDTSSNRKALHFLDTPLNVIEFTIVDDFTNDEAEISATISDNYIGQTSITTLGDIVAGTWGPLATTIAVPSGGTGVDTLTDKGILFGNATNAVGATAVGIAEQILTSNGTGISPTFKTLVGTADRLSILSSPTAHTFNIDPAYIGQTSITTLGVIGAGTWNADTISVLKGGTGNTLVNQGGIVFGSSTSLMDSTAAGSEGQLLISHGTSPPTFENSSLANTVIVRSAADLPDATEATLTSIATGTQAVFTFSVAHTYTNGQTIQMPVVLQIPVTSGGSGYVSVPNVTITLGGGTGVTATAVLGGGGGDEVVSITVDTQGTSFTSIPTVTIDPPASGTQATAVANMFFPIENVTEFTFEISGIPFIATATGTTIRCLAPFTAYTIATPIFTVEGYRQATVVITPFVQFNANVFYSTNIGANFIIMVGTGKTFLTSRGINFMHFIEMFVVGSLNPLVPENTLMDVVGGAVFAGREGFLPRHSGFTGFADLGIITDTVLGAGFHSFTGFTTGLTVTNSAIGVAQTVVQPVGSATWLTINNLIPNPLVSVNLNTLSSFGAPGTSMLDINPATPDNNTVVVANSSATFGGDYFKPGIPQTPSTGAITAFAGTIGVSPTTVTDVAHGLVTDQTVDISATTNYNGRFVITRLTDDTFDISIPFVIDDVIGTWNTVRGITAMATNTANNGDIDSEESAGGGFTQINATDIGTTLLNGDTVVIVGTVAYNGTFVVSNVVDSTSFDIPVTFVTDEGAIGTWTEQRTDLTVTEHELSLNDPILVDNTIDYDGGFLINAVSTNIITIKIPFTTDEAQGLVSNGSLTQSAKNVLLNTVIGQINSKSKGSFTVSNNTTATDTNAPTGFVSLNIDNATIKESLDTELFRLTNKTTTELTYGGLPPFSGQFVATMLLTKTGGGTPKFDFRAVKNNGIMVDNIVTTFDLTTAEVSAVVVIPITADNGDSFKLEVRQSGTGNTIVFVNLTVVIQ